MRLLVAAFAICLTIAACDRHHPSVPPPGPPRPGGVMRVGFSAVSSVDPMMATSPSELQLATLLYTPLTVWDPQNLGAVPGIAGSWSVTADQQQWTFALRPGMTFSDGRPVSASDVVFTYSRIFAKGSHSPAAPLLADVSRVTAVGTSVQVVLRSPLAILPDILGNPAFGIVEAAAPPVGPTPVGSGPFMVTANASGNMTLVKSPGSRALVDGISVAMFPDDDASYAALRVGNVDWSRVPPGSAAEAASLYHQNVGWPLDAELFYGFNLRDPVVADAALRSAIVHAVDRRALASGAYRGTALALPGLFPASTGCRELCTFDPASARSTLASLFGPTGPPALTVAYDRGVTQDAVARTLANDLRAVGVFANLKAVAPEAYLPNPSGTGDELFREGWVARYPGPDGVLWPLFASGQPDNLTGFASSEVDAALRAARAEANPDARAADYAKIEGTIMQQAPVVPLVEFETYAVSAPGVHGVIINGMGIWDPTTVWLAKGR